MALLQTVSYNYLLVKGGCVLHSVGLSVCLFVCGQHYSTNLLAVLDAWTEAIEEGKSIDTIYLDFAKAFDTVPHECLLRKLDGLGVQGKC